MTAYNVDYSFAIEVVENTVVNADNAEQAEEFAKDYILDNFPEASASTIVIDSVKEV